MSTLLQLQTRCANRFRDPTNIIVLAVDWTDYLNEAMRDIDASSMMWPWREQQTTLSVAPGVRTCQLPVGAWHVLAVWNATDQLPMVPLEGRGQYLIEYPQGTETGSPLHYRMFGDTATATLTQANLEVYPLPTVATSVRVDFWGTLPDLAGATDVPQFPAEYHHLMVEHALAQAYEDDGNTAEADRHNSRFSTLLGNMKGNLAGMSRQERNYEITDSFY